ncbi:transcriptional regulator [Methylosinus sp. Sm6]|uniref:transcriptional regulator n=1 Tax=Methylosinus sp. Sm6 TaxID=2866948 RepID=UPI001C992749|nr:transcriptional regulator [Methylosinus sp. Sm6]MBY6244102.1 transcriptional regulator [Methylosinus sp. Sm6]
MSTDVNVNSLPSRKVADFLANAREAFGDALPDWIEAAANEANRTSATAFGKRIGYSPAVISALCRGKYDGDLAAVEAKVRGLLMGAQVECPVLGEIGRDHCIDEQKKKHVGTSAIRTALFHACRGGCAHSRIKNEGGVHG